MAYAFIEAHLKRYWGLLAKENKAASDHIDVVEKTLQHVLVNSERVMSFVKLLVYLFARKSKSILGSILVITCNCMPWSDYLSTSIDCRHLPHPTIHDRSQSFRWLGTVASWPDTSPPSKDIEHLSNHILQCNRRALPKGIVMSPQTQSPTWPQPLIYA